MMVLGNYTVIDDQLKLNIRVVDVQSGDVVHGEQAEGKAKEHRKVVGRLGGLLASYWTGDLVEDRPWHTQWWVQASGGGVGVLILILVWPGGKKGSGDLPEFPVPPERQ